MFVFLMLTSPSFATAPSTWRPYMSTPNNQQYNGPCTIYAAVHCLEALYNYYYEFGNEKVEIDVDDAVSRLSGGDINGIFQDFKDDGVHPFSGVESFPNFEHAYYGLKGMGRCSSLSDIENRVDNYGPVCIKIKWNEYIREEIGDYYYGDMIDYYDLDPYLHESSYPGFHWVVVVDHGDTLGYDYFQCLNSFETGDSFFFKIDKEILDELLQPGSVLNPNDWNGYAYIHNDDEGNQRFSQDINHINLNKWCAPKIYPSIIPTLNSYMESDSIDQTYPMNFRNANEEMFILSGTATDIYANIDYYGTRTIINVSREYSNGYANDLIVTGTLNLNNCLIRPFGSGDCEGVLTVSNGTLNLYDVLIDDLDYGISIIGGSSTVEANATTIVNADFGIYLSANADIALQNSNIGLSGNDITFDRLIQGGYGAVFDVADNSNNITFSSFHNGLHNPYESVDVGGNFWGSNINTDKYAIFDDWVNTSRWEYRLASFDSSNGAPLPKIATLSPFALARNYESAGDLTNARNYYMESIAQSNDSMLNKRALKGLIRIYKNQNWRADDLRIVAGNEYDNALNKHKPLFDYLYNETYIAEKDYFTAIELFEKCAEKYAGTSMQVEMLSRIANIHGDYLDDPATAKRYADRAAALNPGQPILLSAYWSAGIQYEPSEYTNKFEDVLEYYNIPDEHDAVLAAGSDVTVTPNPFNPSTVIGYTLTSPSPVELSIYSITGQKVATLVNGNIPAGRHSITFDGANLASGIYFYRFESSALNKTGKLMLMK